MGTEHKEYTWNLVAKKLTGEATPEELLELEALLRDNPELTYPLQTITDLWNPVDPEERKEAEIAFNRHLDRMQELKVDYMVLHEKDQYDEDLPEKDHYGKALRPVKRHFFLAYAAVIVVVLLLSGLYFYQRRVSAPVMTATVARTGTLNDNAIYTGNGSRTHLSLPDGTRVWLNAGSRIHYEKNFGKTSREVDLTGEAFFDVAQDAGKPFVIHTAHIDIRVLGTSFNVKSYPADKTTEATLIRGSIEVLIHNRPKDQIIMKANEKLVISNDDSIMATPGLHQNDKKEEPSKVVLGKPTYEHTSGAIIETSWIDDKLIFQDEAFDDLAKQMERWYGVSIRFGSAGQKELRFTGSFEKETIKQALDALKLSASFNYSMEGTQITISD